MADEGSGNDVTEVTPTDVTPVDVTPTDVTTIDDTPADVTTIDDTPADVTTIDDTPAVVKPKGKKGRVEKVVEEPVRRQSMRQCKQKTLEKQQRKLERRKRKGKGAWASSDDDDDEEEENERPVVISSEEEKVHDSDSDPAWSPGAKPESGTGSDDEAKKGGRRSRPSKGSSSAARPRSANNSATKRASESVGGGTPKKAREETANNNNNNSASKPAPVVIAPKPFVTPIQKVEPPRIIVDDRVVQSNFQSGDFVIAIADLEKEIPTIWRIQGKSLLQKYESFEENGKMLYRNLSVYSGWTQNNRVNYQGIAVKFVKNNRGNCVVEYVRDAPRRTETKKVEITMEIAADENGPSKEIFEVFIQTLISQSLDVTFISEITKENDEYFLCSIQEIDKGCDEKKQGVDNKIKWIPILKECIQKLTTCSSETIKDSTDKCEICSKENISTKVKFTGEFYDPITLQLLTEIPEKDIEKTEYRGCESCTDLITTYHRVHHLKYNLYRKCYQKVSDLKAFDTNKESHQILEECLRDIEWMTLLYKELVGIWNACDSFKK